MGFSGKPSKGCAPCRAKRTKCDLAQPACTQCVRKGRDCTGYRNEQDLLFRNETKLVVKKARRKVEDQPVQLLPEKHFTLQFLNTQHPSRLAAVEDEAILHFFAHYNEKFFSTHEQNGDYGFDYILPVYQSDMITGGPVPMIIKAAGLAALGNTKGAPELSTEAKRQQVKVLRRLNDQLQDPSTRVSDSSILTCILLGIFENIICDSQSAHSMTCHLRGAATLAKMRGADQFTDNVAHGIYARMRGFLLAYSLQTRDPIPDFVTEFLEDEGMAQRDFEPTFYRLLINLCHLRTHHKIQNFVDANMARQAQALMNDFDAWQPSIQNWDPDQRPLAYAGAKTNADETYRFTWIATVWIFKQTAMVLASDMVIEWARGEVLANLASPFAATLEEAELRQIRLCDELRASTEYYLAHFKDAHSAMRTVGGYGLLWPLYVLSTAATSTPDIFNWIAHQADKMSDEFAIRQGKAMADFIRMYTQALAVQTPLTSYSG